MTNSIGLVELASSVATVIDQVRIVDVKNGEERTDYADCYAEIAASLDNAAVESTFDGSEKIPLRIVRQLDELKAAAPSQVWAQLWDAAQRGQWPVE